MSTIIQLAQKSKISDQEFIYHYQNLLVGARLPKSQRFRKSGLLSKLDNRNWWDLLFNKNWYNKKILHELNLLLILL